MYLMDFKGQISLEFILIVGFMLLLSCSVALFIGDDSELTHAMAAARSGASEGAIADSLAIYPDITFQNYMQEDTRLLSPSSVKIVKINYTNKGFNSSYNRTRIQLHIYATGTWMNGAERYRLGERINFYARKSICEVFNTQDLSNYYFNPAFSDKYVFTTAGVEWV